MPSDHPVRAPSVCINCKARKKKCDKVSPTCGYCSRKGLQCHYRRPKAAVYYARPEDGAPSYSGLAEVPDFNSVMRLSAAPTVREKTLSLQAQQIISTTGQYLDEISVRYFQTVHSYIPIISRKAFHASLITFGSAQQPDFALLMLIMGLLTYRPIPDADTTALYLSSRSLFLQAQALCKPSLRLVQAGILLAVYEYSRRSPDHALITLGGCVRMAHSTGLRRPSCLPGCKPPGDSAGDEAFTEHTNKWWGILIYERLSLCEQVVIDQPLVSQTPEISLTSSAQDGFCQAAQAAWLLDRVLGGLSTPDSEDRHTRLQGLDLKLQSFLVATSEPSLGASGAYCWAISIAIRTMFLLHHRLLGSEQVSSNGPVSSSLAALDTLTRMVVDIADLHEQFSADQLDGLPPSYGYIIRSALENVYSKNSEVATRLKVLKVVKERWGAGG
ncbi:hypothetical protein BJX64DRAFT_270296 [Aspergillus heterothallicus]